MRLITLLQFSCTEYLSCSVLYCNDFTALHGMQTQSYDENSVCSSVRPSICQTLALWQNGRKIRLHFYTIWKIIYPSFLRKRMVGAGRGATPSTWNFGSTGPRCNEIANFEPI